MPLSVVTDLRLMWAGCESLCDDGLLAGLHIVGGGDCVEGTGQVSCVYRDGQGTESRNLYGNGSGMNIQRDGC